MLRKMRLTHLRRPFSLLACLIALFVSAFSFAQLVASYNLNQLGDLPDTTADVLPFGINASLENDDNSTQIQKLNLIQQGGYSWVRQRFPWREIEPTRHYFDWEKWDHLVDLYNQYGLKTVAILDSPPVWSRQDNNWPNRPPDDLDDFGYFVRSFVTHFRGRIPYIQIWDEPNIFPNWGNRPVDPEGYTSLLKVAYENAKAADPTVKVLSAGLAPNLEKGGRNMSDLLFLREMYRHGAGKYFDILAVKPYGLWTSPEDRRVDDNTLNFSRAILFRQIAVQNGFTDVPVWAVEFGWNSLPKDWPGPPSIWGATSEEEQAAYTRQAYERAWAEWPWMQVMILQGMLPERYPDDPLYGFSTVDQHLQPRPVYDAVRNLAVAPTAGVGSHGPDSPYVSFAGQWRTESNARVGVSQDSFQIPFRGTRLDLKLWKTPQGGVIQVSVDGQPVSSSPELSGEGTLDIYSERAQEITVVGAAGLPDGEHVLRAQIVGASAGSVGKPELRFGGFIVRREVNEPWMAIFGALWIVWTGVALWGTARTSLSLVPLGKRAVSGLHSATRQLTAPQAATGIVFGLVLLYFGPGLPASALGLAVVVALVCYHLETGLLFVVLSTPFYMRPKSFGSVEFSLAEILILTCAFAYAIRWLAALEARRQIEDNLGAWRAHWPVVFFLMVGLLSLVASTMLRESLRELRTVIIEPIVYYFLLATSLRGKQRALGLANALILAGFVISAVGLFQYMFTGDVITAEGVRRIRGFYGSPNNLGLFLGRVIPIAFSLAWLGSTHRRRYLVALAMMLAALFLSFSVGAWGAVAMSALFVAAFRGRKALAWAAAGVATGGLALVPLLQVQRIGSHFSLQQGTTLLRINIWQAALNMARDNPVLGIGLDNFLYKYPRYMLPDAWREPNLSHPHNLVLDFWLSMGSLGVVVILWLLYSFFSSATLLYRKLDDTTSRALIVGLMASMVDFVLHGLVDNSYFVVDLAIIFWASLATVRMLEREGD